VTEIQRYEVLESDRGFELRSYPAHTLVTIQSGGDFSSASFGAFGYLAGYIGGNNQSGQNIAMTAPVLQEKTPHGYLVSFVLPDGMTNPPAPIDSKLQLDSKAATVMAALRFSGPADQSLFEAKAQALRELCGTSGLVVISEPLYARYNGPWTLPMLRRNEVLLRVTQP
jgi:hypothetical protein